jgi:hypothetical protein
MTTWLKALRLTHAALVIGLLAHSNIASAQVEIRPGESVDGQFTAKRQEQQYTVEMEAGERLLVHIESVGATLSTYFVVFDPGGDQIEGSRIASRLQHDLQSRVLSASGAYRISIWNDRGVGDYTISIGKIDRGGRTIPPGSKGSEGSREP